MEKEENSKTEETEKGEQGVIPELSIHQPEFFSFLAEDS